ncbi:MAG TPA: MBL fold metallo-hydrolase [Solirubrobacteraceae bacterium]|nr:MBL fold metallo-hydrolase [Solirubrobacteraceae bacterium]
MTLAGHDVALVRAGNPGPFTLTGTNTWIVGRSPCWIVDPGPALDEHVAAVAAEVERRGGAGGIALTHGHADHAEAVPLLRAALRGAPVALAAAAADADERLAGGSRFGPLLAVATPGHTADHLAFVAGAVAFTGDAVLGEGSVFVVGQLGEYLDALRALRDRGLDLLCPGHGPVVEDPAAKLDEYVAHRLDRELRLLEVLDDGARSVDDLLDRAWSDALPALRPAAAATLGAHLEKLAAEGRLPEGVERPSLPEGLRAP